MVLASRFELLLGRAKLSLEGGNGGASGELAQSNWPITGLRQLRNNWRSRHDDATAHAQLTHGRILSVFGNRKGRPVLSAHYGFA